MNACLKVWTLPVLRAAVWLGAAPLAAAEKAAPSAPGHWSAPDHRSAQEVELFAAIQHGNIDVKIYPQDSTCCRLLVTNKTDRPLSIALPAAFAAVPVLAQLLPPNQQQQRDRNREPQPLGVSPSQDFFNNPGGGALMNVPNPMQARAGARALFNVAPERRETPVAGDQLDVKTVVNLAPKRGCQLRLRAVCLDFPKSPPGPRIPYEIKPLTEVTRKSGVYELCAMLGRSDVRQPAVQAAAWHLTNNMSWEELARKTVKPPFGPAVRIFTRADVEEARRLAESAVKAAGPRAKSSGSTETGS